MKKLNTVSAKKAPKILFIDTCDNDVAELAILSPKDSIREKFLTIPTAENFPQTVKKFLRTNKLEISDLDRIAIRTGPGFFSRVRTGVVAANALAYTQNIKLVPVTGKIDYKKLLRGKGLSQVRPMYGARPNITKSKNKWQV